MPGPYFLGADVGGTKTHVAVADAAGQVLGFGRAGSGNPQNVGQAGLYAVLHTAAAQALAQAGLSAGQISAAGFGIGGYDWPSEHPAFAATVSQLGLGGPCAIVNDATLGLLAGAPDGWGVCVVAGTGCNCRGWDPGRRREGRVTGLGLPMGEAAGAAELVERAVQLVSQVWSRRRPPSQLTEAFVRHTGARDLADLLEGYTQQRYALEPEAVVLILEAARAGDPLAVELIDWAGCELGEMANGVIRQLEFETLGFDVVLIGSLFAAEPRLAEGVRAAIHAIAPGARLIPLRAPPVLGALVLALEQAGRPVPPAVRQRLTDTLTVVARPSGVDPA